MKIMQDCSINVGISEHFQQQGVLTVALQQPADALLHRIHILSLTVTYVVLLADTLGSSAVAGSYKTIASRTLLQPWQHVEDAALAIVQ